MVQIFTPQLFIFDTITQLFITIACIVLFVRTRELYNLSLQKGLKYFSTAMVFYIISFSIRYTSTVFDFIIDLTYGTFEQSIIGISLSALNIFAAIMGALYLALSLMWRMIEKDQIKKSHFAKILGMYIFAALIVIVDMFLVIKYSLSTPYIFFGVTIAVLLYAILANHQCCKKLHMRTSDPNPFMSIMGLSLGVYVIFLIESILDPILFTIHYYVWGIAVVLVMAVVYHVVRLVK